MNFQTVTTVLVLRGFFKVGSQWAALDDPLWNYYVLLLNVESFWSKCQVSKSFSDQTRHWIPALVRNLLWYFFRIFRIDNFKVPAAFSVRLDVEVHVRDLEQEIFDGPRILLPWWDQINWLSRIIWFWWISFQWRCNSWNKIYSILLFGQHK